MTHLKNIRKEIYPDCLEIEKSIRLTKEKEILYWARSNANRYALTIKEILDYIEDQKINQLKILNASDIGAGQLDFPIINYLIKNLKIEIKWTVNANRDNEYLLNKLFKQKLDDFAINLHYVSIKNCIEPIEEFDIVLYTESIEHIDYSMFLNNLKQLKKLMAGDGVLFVSTPNFFSLGNRLNILFGSTQGMYWGDGYKEFEKGTFGHITYYSIERLKRILTDLNIQVMRSYTFNYGYRISLISRTKAKLKNIFINLISDNLNSYIFIIAKKEST